MRDLFDCGEPDAEVAVPRSLAEARRLAAGCTRCDLYRNATQTVFGEGPISARIMLVGEQPGDKEDIAGRPFVGPSGQVLDRALEAAGIARKAVFLTNGVKHFKNEPRGKRRLHKRPDFGRDRHLPLVARSRAEVRPSRSDRRPLGATAIRAVTGRSATVSSLRGRRSQLPDGTVLIATIHPSYLLRIPDQTAAETEFGHFVADLRRAVSAAEGDRAA